MSIVDDIAALHRQTGADLERVGPDAPSGLPGWTAADLAAHLVSQYGPGRLVVALARYGLARGIRPPGRSTARTNAAAVRVYGRSEFANATARIALPPPSVLTARGIAHLELFEIWTHGDDLRRANNLGDGLAPDSLTTSIAWLLRLHRRALAGDTPDAAMSLADQMRWLTGRPSAQPAHDPPLSI